MHSSGINKKIMKPKLLIISPFLPWPLRSGGNVGVFYMLSCVTKYMDVTLITTLNKVNTRENCKKLEQQLPELTIKMYDYKMSEFKKYEYARKLTKRIDERLPFGDSKANRLTLNRTDQLTPGFIKYINDYINQNKIGIVQVEFVEMLSIVYALPKTVKKIFIHHELGWVRDELTYGTSIYDESVKAYLKDNEIAMCNRYDTVAALTDVDKQKLAEAGVKTNLTVSTLAISKETQPYVEQIFNGHLSFVGGSGHNPNYVGITWFVKNVLPLVRKQLPKVQLDVVGNWPEQARKDIHAIDPSVNFLGFVDKLEDGIRNTLMVVPITIGSGMRMKILEAANHSVPFVATVVGAEGLDFHSGKDCFIEDDPLKQAELIVKLCKDPELFNSMSKAIHQNFVDNYSYETLGARRLELYK